MLLRAAVRWRTVAAAGGACAARAWARCEEDLYATLGVGRKASAEEIRRAYKLRAAKAHRTTAATPRSSSASRRPTRSYPTTRSGGATTLAAALAPARRRRLSRRRLPGGGSQQQQFDQAFRLFEEMFGGGGGGGFGGGGQRPLARASRQSASATICWSRVSLLDALTGFAVDAPTVAKHDPRGRTFRIAAAAEDLPVAPDDVWVVKGEGMRDARDPSKRGDLFVRFIVDFPKALPEGTGRRGAGPSRA
ncbi:hypothetical protein JL720_12718 [Aureococcus anophagefferens]|nr:hypothetical protein JL720_12718 [Aureococcus anophagefferens]